MSASPPAIAVFGASGHTGRFVLREIERRGVTAIPVGRDAAPELTGPELAMRLVS